MTTWLVTQSNPLQCVEMHRVLIVVFFLILKAAYYKALKVLAYPFLYPPKLCIKFLCAQRQNSRLEIQSP